MTEELSPFQRYLAENDRTWRRLSPPPAADAPAIVVDLMVDHPQYYLVNLLVAKYLQRLSGARILGIADTEKHRAVYLAAKSFGIDKVVAVNDWAVKTLATDLPETAARLQPLTGAGLRRALLDLDCDGLPIGDLVYDTYLRTAKQTTVDTCNRELLLEVSLGLNATRVMRTVLDSLPRIEAAVVGHNCYIPYGALCRLAEARGADVHFVTKMRFAANVQRYSAAATEERYRLRIDRGAFEAAWNGDRDRAVERGKALLAARMAGQSGPRSGLMGGFDPENPMVSVPGLFGRAEESRRERPVLCVMATSFADAPHANARNVYDDQYVWLDETLKIARATPDVDWVIKLHPYTGLYVDRDHVAALVSGYADGSPNIRLMPETANTRSLVGAIDGLITPWGTGGLEFACLGVPVVTAGDTYYSDLGFTVDARTVDDYRAALAALPDRTQNADAMARAAIAVWLYFDAMLCDCPLLPEVEMQPWKSFDEFAYWRNATERLADFTIEDDPLFQRVERYQETGAFSI